MSNQDAVGYVTLQGQGFVAKPTGSFQPGEYKRMSNIELDSDGFLKNRRNIYSTYGQDVGATITPIVNSNKLIGSLGEYTVVTAPFKQYMVNKGTFNEIWNSPTVPAGTGSFARIVGCFRYNNSNYWIVLEFTAATSIGLVIYNGAIPNPDIPSKYDATYKGTLTRTVLFTFAVNTNQYFDFQFYNFLLHKERLWISTSVGVYASAATDPTNFTVPAGFFINYPDNTIRHIMAVRDTIYVLCDEQIHALNYNNDPNADGQSVVMSPDMGAEHGCIHQGVPYCINNIGIFRIDDYHLTKIQDSRFDVGTDYYQNFLYSFQEYLLVNKCNLVNYDNLALSPVYGTGRANLFPTGASDTVGGSQITTGFTLTDDSSTLPLRKNGCRNPNFEQNVNLWSSSSSNWPLVQSSNGNGIQFGTKCLEAQAQNVPAYSSSFIVSHQSAASGLWTAGKTAYVSAYVNSNSQTVYLGAGRFSGNVVAQIRMTFQNASGNAISVTAWGAEGSIAHGTPSNPVRISQSGKIPSGTNTILIEIRYLWQNGGLDTNTKMWCDGVLLEQADSLQTMFDGSSVVANKQYAWTGTTGASYSTEKLINHTSALTAIMDSYPGKVMSAAWTAIPAWYKGTDQILTVTKTLAVTLTAGTSYTLSQVLRSTSNNFINNQGNSTIQVECLDDTNAVLSTNVQNVNNISAVWGEYDLQFTPPANTTQIRITYTFVRNEQASASTDLWGVLVANILVELSSTYSGYFNGSYTSNSTVTYAWAGTAFASQSNASITASHAYLQSLGYDFTPGKNKNSLGYNFYAINMDNGFTHVIDFKDRISSPDDVAAGYVVNCLANNIPDETGNQTFYFLVNKLVTAAQTDTYWGSVYYMSSSEDVEVNDYVVGPGNILHRHPPKIDVEIDSYDPQVLIGFKTWVPTYEYALKRFRFIEVHGQFPAMGIDFRCAYDNAVDVLATTLADNPNDFTLPRPPFAHRFGLNQKARSVSLRMNNKSDWLTDITSAYGFFSITDLRVIYTDTKRTQTGNSSLETNSAY
jgi:hypothetical protein